MDPNETLKTANEHGCTEAIRDLAEWLRRGGFKPDGKLCQYSLKYWLADNRSDVRRDARYVAKILEVDYSS